MRQTDKTTEQQWKNSTCTCIAAPREAASYTSQASASIKYQKCETTFMSGQELLPGLSYECITLKT